MLVFGIVVDLLQIAIEWGLDWFFGLGVIINLFIDWPTMPLTLYIMFRLKGIKFAGSPTRFMTFLVSIIAKTFPITDELPLWTVDIAVNIITSWVEDIAVQSPKTLMAGAMLGKKKLGLKDEDMAEFGRDVDESGNRVRTDRQKEDRLRMAREAAEEKGVYRGGDPNQVDGLRAPEQVVNRGGVLQRVPPPSKNREKRLGFQKQGLPPGQ